MTHTNQGTACSIYDAQRAPCCYLHHQRLRDICWRCCAATSKRLVVLFWGGGLLFRRTPAIPRTRTPFLVHCLRFRIDVLRALIAAPRRQREITSYPRHQEAPYICDGDVPGPAAMEGSRAGTQMALQMAFCIPSVSPCEHHTQKSIVFPQRMPVVILSNPKMLVT